MKIDILNSYDFIDYMRRYASYSEKFSNEGLHALYYFFEELYNDDDHYTVNANELAIFFTEYETIAEFMEDFIDDETIAEFMEEFYKDDDITEEQVIEKLSEEYNIIPFKKHGKEYYSLLHNQ
jgi:hypothetical protein